MIDFDTRINRIIMIIEAIVIRIPVLNKIVRISLFKSLLYIHVPIIHPQGLNVLTYEILVDVPDLLSIDSS